MEKKITKEQAAEIIKSWSQAGNPRKHVVLCYLGQWYDVREVKEEDLPNLIKKLTGIKPTVENTKTIDL